MPPKKGKKMNLDEFLMDADTGGSWADEMDALPTGPSGIPSQPGDQLGGSHLSRNMRGGRDDGGFGSRPDRNGGFGDDRPQRTEVPIPTAPPYTAFVGNLSFDVSEASLGDFFGNLQTTSIRLVAGYDGKPKGFGYVEFSTVDDLKSALALSNTDLDGRVVRISVAEPPKAGGREGRADEESTWTRSGPLAALPGRSGPGGGGGFDRAPRVDRDGGFGAPRGEDVEREGPIRGGKFVASAPSEPRRSGGFDNPGARGPLPPRQGDRVPSRDFQAAPQVEVERDGPIRGGKFVASAPAPERERSFGRNVSGPGGPADEEKTWTRGAALPPRAARTFGDQTPPSSGESTPTGGAPQRQRLQLSARSTSTSTATSPTATPAATSSKASPFGAAKPVDNASRQAEVDAKLAKEREAMQAKLAAEKEKREKDKKEEAANKDRDVEEKIARARKEAGAAKAESPAPDAAAASSAAPAEAAKPKEDKSLRKEGFSYSSMANVKETAANAAATVKDAVADVTAKVAKAL